MRRFVIAAALLGLISTNAAAAAAAPRSRALTHTVALDGTRITSTISGDTKSVVEWEFFGPDGSDLWYADTATLGGKTKSVTTSYAVPCPAGAGAWQVHYQAHSGGRLVGSDTRIVTVSC